MATNDTTFNGHMPVSISNSDYTHITKPIQRHGYAGTSDGNNIVTYIECIDCGTTTSFGPENITIENYKSFIENVSRYLKNMEERLAQAESTISSLGQMGNLAWINGSTHEITDGTLKFNNTSNPNFEGNIILTHIVGDEYDDPETNIGGMIKQHLQQTFNENSNWHPYKYTGSNNGIPRYTLPNGFSDGIFAINMNGEIVENWINTPGIYIVGYDESKTSAGYQQAPPLFDDESEEDWGDTGNDSGNTKTYVNSCINNIIYIITNVGLTNTDIVQATSITLDKSSLEIDANSTGTITATVNPSNASNKTIQWSSSDTSIATISSNTVQSGNTVTITWVSAGTVTITASIRTTSDANKTATCEVICKAPNSISDFIDAYYYLGYLGTSDDDINQNTMFITSLGKWIHEDNGDDRIVDSWDWNSNGIANINYQIGTGNSNINNGQALVNAIISSNGLECKHSLSSNNDILVFFAPADIIDFLYNNYYFKNNSSNSMNARIDPVLISDSQTYNGVNYKIIIFNIPDTPISCDSLTCIEK